MIICKLVNSNKRHHILSISASIVAEQRKYSNNHNDGSDYDDRLSRELAFALKYNKIHDACDRRSSEKYRQDQKGYPDLCVFFILSPSKRSSMLCFFLQFL